MGKMKQLWQDRLDEVYKDYTDSIITFDIAFKRLCTFGCKKLDARDTLDALKQLRLFPDEVELTITGGFKYEYGQEKKGEAKGKQEQTGSNTQDKGI